MKIQKVWRRGAESNRRIKVLQTFRADLKHYIKSTAWTKPVGSWSRFGPDSQQETD